MDYFYAPPGKIRGRRVTLEGEEHHHLAKVLRKKVGDEIYVVDGKGRAYRVTLNLISRSTAEGEIQETFDRWKEPRIEVRLAIALLKNPSRLDFLVEKCTELGAREFIPMKTGRSIASRIHLERLQKIALAAMKQSGRSFLPTIGEVQGFAEVLVHLEDCDEKFIPHEQAASSLAGYTSFEAGKKIGVLIGPEGGFTDEEVESAINCGFQPVSLGPRRLRSETAAIAVVSRILQS